MPNVLSTVLPTLFSEKWKELPQRKSFNLHLLYSKCVPIFLYSLEVCPPNIYDIRSLDFVIDRLFMKLSKLVLMKRGNEETDY